MAYNKRYNPDALPAHVEPEQAAQLLSRTKIEDRAPRDSKDDRGTRDRDRDREKERDYANRPPPPPPVNTTSTRRDRDDRYDRGGYTSPRAGTGGGYDRYEDREPRDRRDRDRDRERGKEPERDDRRGPPNQRTSSYNSTSRRDDYDDGRPRQGSYGGSGEYDRRGYDDRKQPPASRDAPPPTTVRAGQGGNDRESLWPMFQAVDKDHSGQLSERELGSALVNGDYTAFDPATVSMMIRMFDVDRSGTISFDEFCGLWGFLSEWKRLFDRFDVDRSGNISIDEFSDALKAFGYRLSPECINMVFSTYDRRQRGILSFDLFVQSCISLKRMTDVFKKYDTDQDGVITLTFEQFIEEAIRQR